MCAPCTTLSHFPKTEVLSETACPPHNTHATRKGRSSPPPHPVSGIADFPTFSSLTTITPSDLCPMGRRKKSF